MKKVQLGRHKTPLGLDSHVQKLTTNNDEITVIDSKPIVLSDSGMGAAGFINADLSDPNVDTVLKDAPVHGSSETIKQRG